MFEEDFPPPGYRNPTESFLFWYLTLSAIFASWSFGGGTYWAAAALVALGMLAPILIQVHKNLDLFDFHRPMAKFLLAMSPLWFTLAIQAAGLLEPSLKTVSIGDREYLTLSHSSPWTPLNTNPDTSWISTLLTGSLYAMGLCIPFIAASHFLFRKILVGLTINTLVLCIVGFVLYLTDIDKILGVFNTPSVTFFSTFPHGEHWAAFALLWLIVLTGLIDHFFRRQSIGHFMERGGILMLAAITLLAVSIIINGSALQILLLAIFATFVCIQIASTRQRLSKRKWAREIRRLSWILAGIIILASACLYIGSHYWHGSSIQIDLNTQTYTTSISTNISAPDHLAIIRDSLSAIKQQPWFGWGNGSYATVMAFYQQSDLGPKFIATPNSDLVHSLVERGIIGTLAWCLPVVILLWRWQNLKFKRIFSYYLWGAALCAIIMGITSFPFQSPSFTLSFWIIIFSAFQWSRVATTQSPKAHTPKIVFSAVEIQNFQRRS